MAYFSMLDQIHLNAEVIVAFLANLENAITFSKLHIVHPDLLPSQNLKDAITDLNKHYKSMEILKLA